MLQTTQVFCAENNKYFNKLGTDSFEVVQTKKGSSKWGTPDIRGVYNCLEKTQQEKLEKLLEKSARVTKAICEDDLKFKIKDFIKIEGQSYIYFEDNLDGDSRFFVRCYPEVHHPKDMYISLFDFFMGGKWIYEKSKFDPEKNIGCLTTIIKHGVEDGSTCVDSFKPRIYIYGEGYLMGTDSTISQEEVLKNIKKFKGTICNNYVKDRWNLPIRHVLHRSLLQIGSDILEEKRKKEKLEENVESLKGLVNEEI